MCDVLADEKIKTIRDQVLHSQHSSVLLNSVDSLTFHF